MTNLKMMVKLTAQARRQSISIQRKLTLYWASLIAAVFAALLLVLGTTGVFTSQPQKVHEALQLQLQNEQVSIEQHMKSLEAQGLTLSRQVSDELNRSLTVQGMTTEDLNDNPKLLYSLYRELFDELNTSLQLAQCSGAYVILNATTNTGLERAPHSASGLYLRYANLNATGASPRDVFYFRGNPDIAREKDLELHNRWDLEFDTSLIPGYNHILQMKVDRLANACRWTERFCLTDTWEDVVLLLVPVLANDRSVCGVCGVEISSLYAYISNPRHESAYGPMVTLLAPAEENLLRLDRGLVGGAEGTFLSEAGTLDIRHGTFFNTYSNGADTYIGLQQETTVIGLNGRPLIAAVLVPEHAYREHLHTSLAKWLGSTLAVLLLTLLLSVWLSRRFTRPIVQTLQAIQSDEQPQKNKTGIFELDNLLDFINSKAASQPLSAGSLPPDIDELFCAFAQRAKTLTTAERGILKYYVDGFEISEVPDLAFVSIHTVKKHNSNIYQKLGISSRDELMLYIELFRRCGRLKELTDPD